MTPSKTRLNLTGLALGATALTLIAGTASADQVIADDLIVQGSLCAGIDCVNGESFGFDTIRLKENNLRIKAQDTSVSASFPTVDWQITFNDSSNGGANKFSIDNIDNGKTPFTILNNAPSNSLFVDGSGRIGLGTATPVVNLHVVTGNTPTLRLEQNASQGFTAQTWDLAGNEANFFIRDATNGSALPFRITPGAPTNSIAIRDGAGELDGAVGIGIQTATAPLHVLRSNDVASAVPHVRIENTNATQRVREMLHMTNKGGSFVTLENTATSQSWFMIHENNAPNRLFLNRSDVAAGQNAFILAATGDMSILGTLTQGSDKNNKMAIEPIDPGEILAKVQALPVSAWTYKHDAEAGTRHIGPMAQDFYALFGTGNTDKGISTLDSSGVALAAIQALSAENDALKARLSRLEAAVSAQQ